ncbi:MAG: hypothetical protein K5787_13600, partial [Lentisphaeria bacterium]|nr:hypothetical protein [Lentisphaeria bacterium]
YLILICMAFLFHIVGHRIMIRIINYDPFFRRIITYLNPIILFSSISLLQYFKGLKVKIGKQAIKILSSLAFSVYLIHAHPLMLKIILRNRINITDLSIVPFSICIIIIPMGIYILCSLLDYIRLKLFSCFEFFISYIISYI